MDHDPQSLLSPAATKVLTDEECSHVWGAMWFLAGCAQLVGIPHAEWWQLHYQHGAWFPWRVIDVAAPKGPDGTSHTVITLRFGDWRYPDDPSPAGRAKARYRAIYDLRIELEGRGCTLRGVWELRDRGYTSDLMAASRLTPPRPAPPATVPDGAPQ